MIENLVIIRIESGFKRFITDLTKMAIFKSLIKKFILYFSFPFKFILKFLASFAFWFANVKDK